MASGKVRSGGNMFGTPKPEVSKETQDLLNLMMKESKLTNFQRRQLNSTIKDGKSLPASCNPTSSQSKQKASPITGPVTPKVLNGRHLAMSGKRRKDTIDTMVQDEPKDVYRPLPGKVITEKDKRKLQNKMAYGVDIPEVSLSAKNQPLVVDTNQEEIDEFDTVLNEIEERRQFLKDMESLGQGKKYRTIIQTEISQKIKELEVIDKKRTGELESRLTKEEQEKT